EKRFASGLVPKLELLRAQVQLKNSQSSMEEAQSNLTKSKIFLAKIIGRDDENISITGTFSYESVSIDEENLITRAQKIRSDLKILQLQQEINQNQIKLARSGNKLNFFLFSNYTVQNGFDPMDPDRFIDNWNVGVQVSLPLFDGFVTSHKVQQARLQFQTVQLQEQEIRDLIRLQVRQALITMKQSEHKIANQQQNITLAKEALQVAETQYQNGLVSSLEVLDAQQTLSQSELMHTQASFNHIMAKLDLSRAIEDYSWFESNLVK
ncbi:MAG: TolC family protein, partial [bacterium]